LAWRGASPLNRGANTATLDGGQALDEGENVLAEGEQKGRSGGTGTPFDPTTY